MGAHQILGSLSYIRDNCEMSRRTWLPATASDVYLHDIWLYQGGRSMQWRQLSIPDADGIWMLCKINEAVIYSIDWLTLLPESARACFAFLTDTVNKRGKNLHKVNCCPCRFCCCCSCDRNINMPP